MILDTKARARRRFRRGLKRKPQALIKRLRIAVHGLVCDMSV